MCNYAIIEPNNKELECRRIIMQSIESALKRGDEVLNRLVSKECKSPNIVSYQVFKESLQKIDHEKLKS